MIVVEGMGVVGVGQMHKGKSGYFVKVDINNVNNVSNDLRKMLTIDFNISPDNLRKVKAITTKPKVATAAKTEHQPMEIEHDFDFSGLDWSVPEVERCTGKRKRCESTIRKVKTEHQAKKVKC